MQRNSNMILFSINCQPYSKNSKSRDMKTNQIDVHTSKIHMEPENKMFIILYGYHRKYV